ncbi:hypothetical protein [Algibacillus agarilyticus]|uniref:hypothetical protein n=1 Tax=Algibacillus agarilyticus TaxID=2234133 RepID=UPI000DCF68A6|nr:hypothetical protein [Algibacillus agarilyticus]
MNIQIKRPKPIPFHSIFKTLSQYLQPILLLCLSPALLHAAEDTSHFTGDEISQARKIELINQVKNSLIQPSENHPRLYGDNSLWYQTIARFEALDPNCDWQGKSGWGTIKNIKEEWDRYSLGGVECKSGNQAPPSTLSEHSLAEKYNQAVSISNGQITVTKMDNWRRDNALQIVHLIRRMQHCHQIHPEDDPQQNLTTNQCRFNQTEIANLSEKFIAYEFDRLRQEPLNSAGYINAWHKGFQGKFFDLGAYPAFKLWTLILDTFWHSEYLKPADKQFVESHLANEIDSFIAIYYLPKDASGSLGRWALHNGNNWTPILDAAALFWAITYWHDTTYSAKAHQVLDIVLESIWLHRDEILNDGAYTEGPSYLSTSMNGSLEINNLLMSSFGQPNHAVKWALMAEKTSRWMIENVASDGRLIDFGDAWAKDGYEQLHIMDILYWQELTGQAEIGSTTANACTLQDYFASSYYSHAYYDIWNASAHHARNFYKETQQCQRGQATGKTLIYPEYQIATLRQHTPGATTTAQDVTNDNLRNQQADQTFLAGNAVSNTLKHREIDFGAVIWSAYGNRLLADWGYGELSKPYHFYNVQGANGHLIASNQHKLEFYLKPLSGTLDLSRLFVNLKLKGFSKELSVAPYQVSTPPSDWLKFSIPLIDFDLTDAQWLGKGQGIEILRFKTTGFIKDGEFGLDEIAFVNAANQTELHWYGDNHLESLSAAIDATTPQISHPDVLKVISTEATGGANNSQTWAKFSASGSYSTAEVFYSADPADFSVANYMDYLPIGANTLVLPNAKDTQDNAPNSTNMSQFLGQTGQIYALDIAGRSAVHLNGSAVYGTHLSNGNLDYFHRYLIPLNDGNFIIVDSFKTKPGKADKVQEFWYSNKNPDKTCQSRAQDVTQHINADGALMLTPRCNSLKNNEDVEAYGRITAASLHPAHFELGAPDFLSNDRYFNRFIEDNGLYLINRLQRKEMRNLARFVPVNSVEEDVRVFLLQAATSVNLPTASINKTDCADSVCFNVTIENGDNINLQLNKVDNQYVFANSITAVPLPTDQTPTEQTPPVITPPTTGNVNLISPIGFSVSHPNRVGEPDKLFDEQTELSTKPSHGDKSPELRQTKAYVNLSNSSVLPQKQAVETASSYGRYTYVDENAQALSANFTIELDGAHILNEIMIYDMSSAYRPGLINIYTSLDQQNWQLQHAYLTGEYKQWASLALNNTRAHYIKFAFTEENAAKGITEVLILGEKAAPSVEQLITPVSVNSLHNGRIRDANPLFDEQIGLTEKPQHLASLPELRASYLNVNFSNTDDLPMKQSVPTDSLYGRHIYVDELGQPMPAEVIIKLDNIYELTEILYYDMSSQFRPGKIIMWSSTDGINWTRFNEHETGEYKKWISLPLVNLPAQYLKLDLYEQNTAKGLTEMLIYGKELH